MRTITSIPTLRHILQQARRRQKSIGFVPTMGALHEGHLSLFRRCQKENDLSVASIFVNPKQFSVGEDYERYPRDKKKDELLAKKGKVDIMFYPSDVIMYPDGYMTHVKVERLSEVLCGRFRPGHFQGVTTVVAKLLNIVSPDILYLGQKDAQQAVIIKQMIQDLDIPVRVKVLPTLREKDGLAMSSRNQYLTLKERRKAPILYKALCQAKAMIRSGERRSQTIMEAMRAMIQAVQPDKIDYIECVDAQTLSPLATLKGNVLIPLAVWFGQARLIDNVVVRIR